MQLRPSILNRKSLSPLVRLAACFLLVACLAGCGKSMSGTYAGESPFGTMTLQFKGGHKATSTAMGQMRDLTYSIEADKLIIDTGKGTKEIWTISKDGSLSRDVGLMSVTLKKK